MDKMEHESEESLVETMPASSRNSLVGGSSGKYYTVATDEVSPEDSCQFFSKHTLQGSTSSPRMSGLPQVLPGKVLRSIAALLGQN